jgi:hypothetical protein
VDVRLLAVVVPGSVDHVLLVADESVVVKDWLMVELVVDAKLVDELDPIVLVLVLAQDTVDDVSVGGGVLVAEDVSIVEEVSVMGVPAVEDM